MRSLNSPINRLLVIALLLVSAVWAHAAPAVVILHATQDIILADGKQQTTIWAQVNDTNGRPVNGAAVQFQTTAGNLTQTRVTVFNGRAETRLISATIAGVAHVTAIVEGSAVGVANTLDIEFTDDPDETFAGNSFFLATGSYVVYSPTDHAIEAHGEKGAARLTYRNFEVTADRYQMKCDVSGILRAENHVMIRRGKDVIHAIRLYYSLVSGDGYAVADVGNGKFEDVQISGEHLKMVPLAGKITASYLSIPDLNPKLIIAARSISYFPQDKLQFRRPRFYQDQLQILTLPYYEMPLNSDELFSDHFLSVGSRGLGLEVPYYYTLTPRTSGIITLRHQQEVGSVYNTSEPGWSMDMVQNYASNGALRSDGSYGFTGLLHPDWGFHWSHTQEFNSATQGSFYLDFPQHNSFYSSANLTQQEKLLRIGIDLSAGETFTDTQETTLRGETYAETNPHPLLGQSGLQYVIGARFEAGHVISPDPAVVATGQTYGETTVRAFTRPLTIDPLTNVNATVTLGQVWSIRDQSGFESLATVTLDHKLGKGGLFNLAYDYTATPVDLYSLSGGKHRVSMTYQYAAGKHFQASIFGSTYLDAPTSNLVGSLAYRVTSDWRVSMLATVDRDSTISYKDFELILGRRIGSRELQLTYSTYYHRIYFDLTSTQW